MSASGWSPGQKSFSLAPYEYAEAAAIVRELSVPEPVAIALVRRGHRSVEAARRFLAADERHDPSGFEGIEVAVASIRAAISAGDRITVFGDYDVDGVSATAILTRALRGESANCDWLIPGRVEDGYGLSEQAIDRLRERGTRLIVTVDCGIASPDEVRHARGLGMDVIVTDHHQPGPELPDCPIVHPGVSGYPCPDLCAAGVAYKLAVALRGKEAADPDLDLVALATIADMVPLLGENRSLVRRGLERIRRSPRIGLRALMAVARVAPERMDETDVSFRLAPRINAAGRLYRADAAVELFLSDDPTRAAEIAVELDRANLDRRETEREVLADANRLLAELEADRDPTAAIVLWGEGWHPGVVGICASRMAERHRRPAILIALDAEGRGKGSGRSVPGFDLLGALRACSENLERFGGHRAAAGLEVRREHLEVFRTAFAAHCAQILPSEPASPVESVDAVVGAEALGHELAQGLAGLGPFGVGNPGVRLVVPAARIDDARPMGEEERHSRFVLRAGTGQVRGVAFGVGSTLAKRAGSSPADVSIRLELNEWNGATEPRAVLGTVYEPPEPAPEHAWRASDEEFAERLAAALQGPVHTLASPANSSQVTPVGGNEERLAREGVSRGVVDRRAQSGLAVIGELASSGLPVLVVCADALWRRAIVESAVHPGRYGGGAAEIVAARGSLATAGASGITLVDWAALSHLPDLARDFEHVVVADPAPHPGLAELVASGAGYVHVLAANRELALSAVAAALPDRKELGAIYRSLAEARAELSAAEIRRVLCGESGVGRSPEACGLALRVLAEIGVARVVGSGLALRAEAVSSVRGELSSSMSFRLINKANEECVRYLSKPEKRTSSSLEAAA